MSELLVVVIVLCLSRVLGLSSSIVLRTNNRSHPVLKHTRDQPTVRDILRLFHCDMKRCRSGGWCGMTMMPGVFHAHLLLKG